MYYFGMGTIFLQESSSLVYGYILVYFHCFLCSFLNNCVQNTFLLTLHEVMLCIMNVQLLPRSNATMKKLFVFLVTELHRWERMPGGLIQPSPVVLSCKATCPVEFWMSQRMKVPQSLWQSIRWFLLEGPSLFPILKLS